MQNKAFTLAEVLITLGIIGVVAAMTIPGLIQRTQEKELLNRWIKFHALLKQAILMAEEEYGDSSNWRFDKYKSGSTPNTEGSAYSYLKPYLKIVSDCPTGEPEKNCFLSGYKYSFLDGTPAAICSYIGPAVRLLSGESICFGNGSPHFTVDLNGTSPPNRIGVDIHYFSFIDLPKREFLPGFNWGWRDSADKAEYCNIESSSWHNGASCGFWIQRYKNMKYLHMSKEEVKKAWKPKK